MIRLLGLQPCYEAGESLEFEFRIARIPTHELTAIESSVLWTTEGKGTDDLGVHFFQRLSGETLRNHDWSQPRKIDTLLPNSPLSYEGKLLKIRWSARVRAFLSNGSEVVAEQPFYLGSLTREI